MPFNGYVVNGFSADLVLTGRTKQGASIPYRCWQGAVGAQRNPVDAE
jgi:hypothetical protein